MKAKSEPAEPYELDLRIQVALKLLRTALDDTANECWGGSLHGISFENTQVLDVLDLVNYVPTNQNKGPALAEVIPAPPSRDWPNNLIMRGSRF